MTDQVKEPRRASGRPRVIEKTLNIDPAEHILLESARLFIQQGYQETTTREIADASGLRQGSLYYYFKRKEDILLELLDRIADGALELAGAIDPLEGTAAGKLWALSRLDVANYSSWPINLAVLARLPQVRGEQFASFLQKQDTLGQIYTNLLDRGMSEGSFARADLALARDLVYGVIDAPIGWFDPARHDSATVADLTARIVLLSLLADPTDLDRYVAEGRSLVALTTVSIHSPVHTDKAPRG